MTTTTTYVVTLKCPMAPCRPGRRRPAPPRRWRPEKRSWLTLHKNGGLPFRLPVCPFPIPPAGLWPGLPTPPFVPFPGVPEPFLALRSLEGPRLPVSPGRRPFGRRAASGEYAGGARFQVRPQVWRSRVCFLASHPLLRPLAASSVPPDWPYRVSPWRR